MQIQVKVELVFGCVVAVQRLASGRANILFQTDGAGVLQNVQDVVPLRLDLEPHVPIGRGRSDRLQNEAVHQHGKHHFANCATKTMAVRKSVGGQREARGLPEEDAGDEGET